MASLLSSSNGQCLQENHKKKKKKLKNSSTTTEQQVIENSIYGILTIDRWESLNHMNYKLSPLRAVHGRLALRFLNYLSKQPNFKHMTQCLSITTHILVKAKMYDEAKELLRNLTKLGLGPKLLFDDLMLAYTKCNSNPSIFDLLIRVYINDGLLGKHFGR
ncbi:pentatricopeptide repeat-containing protein At5g55840 [Amborella trichopoda]|uniref:pentatricopeptide repeat-containing protein At5g55840 n=1 Tax=Amborella trichopoda TaxID=13333 RepID=UPI0009BCAAC0|nr:pentatricopeptide repeat-containing protein At5g55840 [Amborella trichopoda]|eukprot:XP_020522799.1 pentatricopeptide repeat-containing protein At5g55840 [Amborella trichopoda]